jgi:hypothetical protein
MGKRRCQEGRRVDANIEMMVVKGQEGLLTLSLTSYIWPGDETSKGFPVSAAAPGCKAPEGLEGST